MKIKTKFLAHGFTLVLGSIHLSLFSTSDARKIFLCWQIRTPLRRFVLNCAPTVFFQLDLVLRDQDTLKESSQLCCRIQRENIGYVHIRSDDDDGAIARNLAIFENI